MAEWANPGGENKYQEQAKRVRYIPMLTVVSATEPPQAKQADTYKGPTTGECRLHDYGFSLLSPCEWYILKSVASFSKFLTIQDFHLHCFLAHLNTVPCQCCECFSQFLARSWNQLDSSQESDCQIPCVHGLILAQLPMIGWVCTLTNRMGLGRIKLEISKLAM